MATKLDKFTGRIDFAKDSPAKITKTLNELRNYLESYSETDAARILGDLADPNLKNKTQYTQKDLNDRERFLDIENAKSRQLKEISDTFKKIQQDLIDEQDAKARDGKRNKTPSLISKGKDGLDDITGKPKEALAVLKDPFGWLKEAVMGRLLGSIIGKLFSPIKAMALGALKLFMKAGGAGWKLVAGAVGTLISPITSQIKNLGAKTKDALTKHAGALKSNMKDTWVKITKSAKSLASKAKESKVGQAISNTWSKVTSAISKIDGKLGNNRVYRAARSTISKGVSKAKSLGGKIKGVSAKAMKALKTKVIKIGQKISSKFGTKGVSKASRAIGKSMPKALGKFGAKFIPGIGMALLAYDVYVAAKKSDSMLSFAVNLIDQVSVGILSGALGMALDDFDGENLGAYVDKLITGSDLDVEESIDIKALEKRQEGIKALETATFGSEEQRDLMKATESHPDKDKIITEYHRLQQAVRAGEITHDQAQYELTALMDSTIKATPTAGLAKTPGISGFGGSTASSQGLPVEGIKNNPVNLAESNTQMVMQLAASKSTMEQSANLAAYISSESIKNNVMPALQSTVSDINIPSAPQISKNTPVIQG